MCSGGNHNDSQWLTNLEMFIDSGLTPLPLTTMQVIARLPVAIHSTWALGRLFYRLWDTLEHRKLKSTSSLMNMIFSKNGCSMIFHVFYVCTRGSWKNWLIARAGHSSSRNSRVVRRVSRGCHPRRLAGSRGNSGGKDWVSTHRNMGKS